MGIIFTATVVACRALSHSVLNVVAKTRIKSRSGHYLFATLASFVALVFVMILSKGIPEIEDADIVHGIILGILAIGEEFFLLSALECGLMSMTSVCALMMFSFAHIAFGIISIPAIALSSLSILLILLDVFNKDFENEREKEKFKEWRKYVLILVGITILVEIEEKSHALAAVGESHLGYQFIEFLTSTIFAGSLFLIRGIGKKERTKFVWDQKLIIIILLCGIIKALMYMVLALAAASWEEELVVEFNCSAAMILLVLIDKFVFKAKLKWNHYLALLLAVISFFVP